MLRSSYIKSNGLKTALNLQIREVHVRGGQAAEFISTHLSTALRLSYSYKAIESNHSHHSVSILLHAERQPQQWPTALANNVPIGSQFFGASLLGASTSTLRRLQSSKDNENKENYGLGDLGLLQLRQNSPTNLVQVPIVPHDNNKDLNQEMVNAFSENLLRKIMATSNPTLFEDMKAFMFALCELFNSHEGIWFSTEIDISGTSLKLTNPYLEFDEFSAPRVPGIQRLLTERKKDDNAALAEKGGLFYIPLPNGGRVGCFGYGAGNAMATMDGLEAAGEKPANFLDGGGGANRANAKLAMETLNRNPQVRSIFINSFGGITQTDVVAQGVVDAIREHSMKKPIIVRLKGTGSEKAREVLQESQLGFTVIDDFNEAAMLAVHAAHHTHSR